MRTFTFLILFLTFSITSYSQKFIEFVYPNSGETFEVNTIDTIKWRATNVTSIKIEYCNNFNSYPGPNEWIEIANNLNGSDSIYLWSVPDTLTSVRLKVSDSTDSLVYDLSDANITFWNPITTPKSLKVISPNGGEILDSVSVFNIAFKGQNIGYIDVEYTIDNGLNWTHIDTLYYGNNPWVNTFHIAWQTLIWHIPNIESNQCKIRILDKTNHSILDESDETYTITGNAPKKIKVLYPNDPYIQLPIDSVRTISWTSTGITNVKIEYADYSFTYDTTQYQWETITASTPANSGSYDWQIPSNTMNSIRIKISDANDSTIYDISDFNFNTYDAVNNPPTPFDLILTSLNGGEIINNSSAYFNISWRYKGNYMSTNIEFQYSDDNGQNWQVIDKLLWSGFEYEPQQIIGVRSGNWEIPNINSNQCKIRVIDIDNNIVIDESDNVFEINNNPSKELELLSPNSGQLAFDSQKDITWNSVGISNIKIEFAENFNTDFNATNLWHTIISSTPASSSTYTWSVPDSLINYVRIRISDVSDNNIYEISDMDISTYDAIANPKDVIVVTPNGGETLLGGSVYNNITWMYKNDYNTARIEYTIDNGTNWEEISSYILTMGGIWNHLEMDWGTNISYMSINWIVPNINSTQCKIRIIDTLDNSIIDESDNVFTIVKDTTLSSINFTTQPNNISLFPNPTRGIVQIYSTENINSYFIYNSNGICVLQNNNVNNKILSINISLLNNDVYFIKFITTKGVLTKKILKTN